MRPFLLSCELDAVGRRLGSTIEQVVAAYGHWNAQHGLNRRTPMATGMDDHLLHDLGLNPIALEVGFVQPQY